jgi:hypothetical protein
MAHQTSNMRFLAQDGLAGFGNIGEGMAIQEAADGRRIMWLAHESHKDVSAVDVTDPRKPRLILQTELPHENTRSNSLAVVGDTMYVAHQTAKRGMPNAGMSILDISKPETPREIGLFDVTGAASRGVHCLWCVDGKTAHLKTSMPDASPRNPSDDQFYVSVDVSDPTRPTEIGRWWIPGTMEGDAEDPPVRHEKFNSGFGAHNINVYPRRPDRAYAAFKDGGVVILDVSDMAHPKQVGRLDYHPPMPGYTHTALPLFDRELLIVTEESVRWAAEDWPKVVWVMDMSVESNIVMLSSLPLPDPAEFANVGGRFGAHNIHENLPVPTSLVSEELIFGTYFNGGLRVHDISNPLQPKEVASFIPEDPARPKDPAEVGDRNIPGINLNDVYVDEKGIVYTADRQWGGLYILELTI